MMLFFSNNRALGILKREMKCRSKITGQSDNKILKAFYCSICGHPIGAQATIVRPSKFHKSVPQQRVQFGI